MYVSGGMSISVGLDGNPIALELDGAGALLVSYTGGFGLSTTVSAAPSIQLLDGAIGINLAAVAQATSSIYFQYSNSNAFTVALQATMTLDPGNFLGAWRACLQIPAGGPAWTQASCIRSNFICAA